jgi:hypothetical protein
MASSAFNRYDTSRVEHQFTQTAHGLSLKDAIYHTGSAWAKAKADDEDTLALGIVTKVIDANNFRFGFAGVHRIASHGFTAGQYYFLDSNTSGALTPTQPTTYSNPVLYAIDADNVLVLPYRPALTGGALGGNTNKGLTLVGRDEVLSGTKTKLQVTGLDGLNYRYKIFWRAQNNGAAAIVKMSFNNELIETNYTGYNQAGTATSNSTSLTGSLTTGSGNGGIMDIIQHNVAAGNQYVWNVYFSGSQAVLDRKSITKGVGSLTNFTSFEIWNMTFDISSFLEVYRYNE